VAKRAGRRYESAKRSGCWVKLRYNCRQEFVIGGYTSSHRTDEPGKDIDRRLGKSPAIGKLRQFIAKFP
jgi:hypothetical protein